MLKDFCEQGDIKLVFEEDLPAIDDFEENILQAFDYEGDDVDEKISLEMQKEMISLLIDKLSELPERELKKMGIKPGDLVNICGYCFEYFDG